MRFRSEVPFEHCRFPIFEFKAPKMSSDAMKLELIQWLSQLEDRGVLNSLFQFMKSSETATDWAESISLGERRSIERGLTDVKERRVTSSKDFWALHDQ